MHRLSNAPVIAGFALAATAVKLLSSAGAKHRTTLLVALLLVANLGLFVLALREEAMIAMLGLTYTFAILTAQYFGGEDATLEKSTMLTYLITSVGLVSNSVVVASTAFVLSLLIPLAGEQVGDRKRALIYCVATLSALGLGLGLLYRDLGGFEFSADAPIRGETVVVFSLAALLRQGAVPFHGYLLQRIRRYGFFSFFAQVNPIGYFLPLLIVLKAEIEPSSGYYEDALLVFGLLLSFYFAVASYGEKSFDGFLYYILLSITSLTIAALPILGVEFELAGVHFYASTLVGIIGVVLCLHIIRRRYGFNSVSPMMGLFAADKKVSYLFLFFVFCIGCMPLTMSFLGEDVLLYQLFMVHPLMGMAALGVLSLVSVSLYRFYIQVFGGPWPNYPRFPLLAHERIALSLLFLGGLALPLMSYLK